jgi:hypothetical protein
MFVRFEKISTKTIQPEPSDILRTGRTHWRSISLNAHLLFVQVCHFFFELGGVPMTKHRRITGFVIVALLAVVATTANVRSHSHSTGLLTASPAMSSTTSR